MYDDELKKVNGRLKGDARTIGSDLMRAIDEVAEDFAFRSQSIRIPYFQKQRQEIISRLGDEKEYIEDNIENTSQTDLLK